MIKPFDNQTESWNPVSMIWLSSHLTLSFDNQSETCLIITINDISIGNLSLIITISDTSKNQPKQAWFWQSNQHIKVFSEPWYSIRVSRLHIEFYVPLFCVDVWHGQHSASSLASLPSTYARPRVSVTIGSRVEGVGSRLGSCMICIQGISRLCSCWLIKVRAARVDLILFSSSCFRGFGLDKVFRGNIVDGASGWIERVGRYRGTGAAEKR